MQGKRLFILSFILVLFFSTGFSESSYAQEQPPATSMSVKLVRNIGNTPNVSVELIGNFQLQENTQSYNNSTMQIKADQNQLVLYNGKEPIYRGPSITFAPHTYGQDHVIKVNGHAYLGEMNFITENGTNVRPINTLPIEDYLKGVVPNEMPASWEHEALKAQAIAARTYAVRRAGQLIDDTVSFQVYNGLNWHERTTHAVEETNGQVLLHDGHLIDALYSSSNGGMTEASGSLWQPNAYLRAQTDPFDPQNPWSLSFNKEQILLQGKSLTQVHTWWNSTQEKDQAISRSIKNWLLQNGYKNHDIKILQITNVAFTSERTAGQRIRQGELGLDFLIKRSNGSAQRVQQTFKEISGSAFRQMLGGGTVFKSLLVDSIGLQGQQWTVRGKGYGHAVGMSQYGANAMAKQAKTSDDIVAFYYPGATLTQAAHINVASNEINDIPVQTVPVPTPTPVVVDPLASRASSPVKQGVVRSTVVIGLRPQPSFQVSPMQTMRNGDHVEVIGQSNRWLLVKFGETTGYVPDNYIH